MTTLVTGAAGFVGTHLADALREVEGTPAVGADLRVPSTSGYSAFHAVNFRDEQAIRGLLRRVRPNRIVHLVGGAVGDDAALEELNVASARRLLLALEAEGIAATTVLLGSAAEYGAVPVSLQPVAEDYIGEPTTPYGRMKAAVTQLARAARAGGQHVIVARPFNIIGPGVPPSLVCGALMARIRDALRNDGQQQITVGRTDAIRDFIAVQDVTRGLALLASQRSGALAYNLCTGTGHSVQELIDTLLLATPRRLVVKRDEGLLRGGDVDQMLGNPSRAQVDLGWQPQIGFAESIDQAWRWAMGPASIP